MLSIAIKARTNSAREKAAALGFHACGFARAGALTGDAERLNNWIGAGKQGDMNYMANNFGMRTDPTLLFPGTRTVIVVLQNYFPAGEQGKGGNLKISRYAYGADYHYVMKRKLKDLARFILEDCGGTRARVFVDSAPVLERAWAREAGLGWIGKNTCLITREQGSFFFIGTILTDALFDYDADRETDHCGGCTRCISACPTGALDKEGLDARRCISYLTIEYREASLPGELKGKMGDWIFGCDICQEVCPWNRLSEPHDEPAFMPKQEMTAMGREDWMALDETRFKELFRDSAVKRAGFAGLRRNILFSGDGEGA